MRTMCIILVLLVSTLAGCTSGERKAAELLETARFEEKQNNLEHATQLYNEILNKYPSSPAAKEATARMGEITRRKP